MRVALGLILVSLLTTGPAVAGDTAAYDLAACIRAALTDSPNLAAAAADLAGAQARLDEARAGRLGQGELTEIAGLVNRARGTVLDPKDSKNDLFHDLGPFSRLDVNLNVPLWTFGRLSSAFEAARQGLAAEQAQGAVKRAEIILSVKQLYYGLLLSRQLGLVLHEMLETMDTAVEKTQQRLDEGSSAVTELDLLKLRIGRSKFAKGVLEIDASAALAQRALAHTIGRPDGAEFDIADRKLEVVNAPLAPLDVYLAEGRPRRPEWQQLNAGLAAQSAKVEMERAGYYPNLFLSTGLQFARAANRTEQTNPFASDDFNYLRPVGVVGLRWDLNFLTTAAKIAQAKAELERLRAQEREAAGGLLLDIRRAYSDLIQQRDTIEALEQGRKAGRALLVATVANFDLGLGDADEIFHGLGAYTEASADYLRAVHDYNVALGALSKAVGQELAGLEY